MDEPGWWSRWWPFVVILVALWVFIFLYAVAVILEIRKQRRREQDRDDEDRRPWPPPDVHLNGVDGLEWLLKYGEKPKPYKEPSSKE